MIIGKLNPQFLACQVFPPQRTLQIGKTTVILQTCQLIAMGLIDSYVATYCILAVTIETVW